MSQFVAWSRGLFSDYAPSLGELHLLAQGHADPEPVAVVAVPVRQ